MLQKRKRCFFFVTVVTCTLLGSYIPDCTDTEATCLSVVDIAAKTIVRCEPGSDLDVIKQSLLEQWVLGDCKLVKKIRDPKGLINDCLPWMERASCRILNSGNKPEACQNQLLLTTSEF
jgi:hypothetical protein